MSSIKYLLLIFIFTFFLSNPCWGEQIAKGTCECALGSCYMYNGSVWVKVDSCGSSPNGSSHTSHTKDSLAYKMGLLTEFVQFEFEFLDKEKDRFINMLLKNPSLADQLIDNLVELDLLDKRYEDLCHEIEKEKAEITKEITKEIDKISDELMWQEQALLNRYIEREKVRLIKKNEQLPENEQLPMETIIGNAWSYAFIRVDKDTEFQEYKKEQMQKLEDAENKKMEIVTSQLGHSYKELDKMNEKREQITARNQEIINDCCFN